MLSVRRYGHPAHRPPPSRVGGALRVVSTRGCLAEIAVPPSRHGCHTRFSGRQLRAAERSRAWCTYHKTMWGRCFAPNTFVASGTSNCLTEEWGGSEASGSRLPQDCYTCQWFVQLAVRFDLALDVLNRLRDGFGRSPVLAGVLAQHMGKAEPGV